MYDFFPPTLVLTPGRLILGHAGAFVVQVIPSELVITSPPPLPPPMSKVINTGSGAFEVYIFYQEPLHVRSKTLA